MEFSFIFIIIILVFLFLFILVCFPFLFTSSDSKKWAAASRRVAGIEIKKSGGEALVVSQFTLCADLRKGRRPGFDRAEAPERAAELVERFRQEIENNGLGTASGRFGAMMDVELVNRGPATFILESDWYHARVGG